MKKTFLIPFIVIIVGGVVGGYFLLPADSNQTKSKVAQNKNLRQINLKIKGMSCVGCERSIEGSVDAMSGVRSIDVNLQSNAGTVVYNPKKLSKEEIVSNSIFDVYPAEIAKDQKYKN